MNTNPRPWTRRTDVPEPPGIVFVEDDPVTAQVTIAMLESAGVEVTAFTTAEEARAHLEVNPKTDLVLSDLMLPGEDGISLCRWLRSDPARSSLPILLVSSASERETRLRALAEGADDLLSKPVDPIELRARVHALTRLSRARTQLAVRDQLDAVVSQVSDGIIVLDESGQMRDVNVRARLLLGLPEDFGAPLDDHLHAAFEVTDREDHDGPGTVRIAHRPRTGAEGSLWLSLTTLPLTNEQAGHVVVVVRDITDERAAAALADTVLGSVAHKLRTPLTGISSVLASLSTRLDGTPEAALVGILDRAARRLDDSLTRILDHASACAAGEDLAEALLEPAKVATTLLEHVSDEARAAVVAMTDDLDTSVLVPLRPMIAAIDEFVANAIAAGDPCPRVHLGRDGMLVELVVIDEGPGIPPEDLDRVFSPFFQVDRTGQADGMGLGLPLIRHLTIAAGGDVAVTSSKGQPTRFTVRLPIGVSIEDEARQLLAVG